MPSVNYCDACKNKIEGRKRAKNKTFCPIGYTQTPGDLESTINVIRNKGQVCSKNPFKSLAYERIGELQRQGIMENILLECK
jgi:hypothetical protein